MEHLSGVYQNDAVFHLECQLVHFYFDVILREIEWRAVYLNPFYVKKVKQAYHKNTIQKGLSNICFQLPALRCAYMFQYGPCFASIVAYHFHRLLNANFWLYERAIFQKKITICCLGGGPSTEFVAIAKVFEAMLLSNCSRTQLLIKATIVDADCGWRVTLGKIVQCLPKLINTSLVKFKLEFIEADLTKPFGEDVQEAIRNSDIVTMVKFLSAIHGTKQRDKIPQMLQEVLECMSIGGILFFMDSNGFRFCDVSTNIINSFQHMTRMYGPLLYDIYKMSYPAVDECFKLYSPYYGLNCCTVQSQNYVIAWNKRNSDYFQSDDPPT